MVQRPFKNSKLQNIYLYLLFFRKLLEYMFHKNDKSES